MTEDSPPVFDITLAGFIQGMKVHDFAKPFFLAGREHALAGFMLIAAIKRETESLYALFHHGRKAEGLNLHSA